jgi:hypothetical protein
MTREEFVNMVAANHKTNVWLSGHFDVEGTQVGIKAYGKWVQRMQVAGKPYWNSWETKTVRDFKAQISKALAEMLC